MWLSMDPTATATSTGSTEGGVWGLNGQPAVVLSRANRANGRGIWGWLSNEGGAGAAAGSGDASFFLNGTDPVRRENNTDTGLFAPAFAQGSPLPRTPNNQWTAVEVDVVGTRTVVRFNGVVFFDEDPGVLDPDASSGVARIGYDDLFTGSATFSPNWIFGLFDNFVVESITGTPALTVAPGTAFEVASAPGLSPGAIFADAANSGAGDLTITGATIDGAHGEQFSFDTPLPLTIGSGGTASLAVTFNPLPPNGLKVARLLLTTDDPASPTISMPLQARREILTIEGSLTTPIGTVITEGGSSAGEITITNQNPAAVTLNALNITGTNAAGDDLSPALPLTIASGASAVMTVTFAPSGTRGVRNAPA